MAGLVPAIHVFKYASEKKTWIPGTRRTRPGMTTTKFESQLMDSLEIPSGAAVQALMDRSCDRCRRPDCSGPGVGPAVARGGTRDCSRFYGRGAEFGARRRFAMAAGDRIRRRRAGLRGIFCARLSLPRLVGIVSR